MTATTAPPRHVNRVVKLLAFALDPSAHEAEAINAATRMVQTARSGRVELPHLLNALAIVAPSRDRQPAPPARPWEADLKMRCGKYRGCSLGELAERDRDYLIWVASRFDVEHIAEAAQTVLGWLANGGAP
jgi:hypothetical protein